MWFYKKKIINRRFYYQIMYGTIRYVLHKLRHVIASADRRIVQLDYGYHIDMHLHLSIFEFRKYFKVENDRNDKKTVNYSYRESVYTY